MVKREFCSWLGAYAKALSALIDNNRALCFWLYVGRHQEKRNAFLENLCHTARFYKSELFPWKHKSYMLFQRANRLPAF